MLQTMLDQSHAQIAYLDPQFNFLAVNASYARGSGYAQEALIGRNHFALFPHAENQALFTQARDSGQAVAFTARPFVIPDRPELGTTYWDWTLVPVKDTRGGVSGLVLSLTDVTPREATRQALETSEARYRLLVDTMAEGLVTLDLNGSITFANDEFCRMLGYTREELIGRHHLEVVYPSRLQLHKDALTQRLGGQPGHMETVLARRDGSGVPVILAGRPMRDQAGAICGRLGAITDISALKTVQQALSAERDFVSAVLDTADALVLVIDPRGRITRFNRVCEILTGRAFDEMRGRFVWEALLVPEERESARARIEALRPGDLPNQSERWWLAANGTRRLIAWKNTALLNSEGAIQYIVSIGTDVTEVRQAEEEVLRLARFPSENPGPVLRFSADGLILYANAASAGLLAMWGTQEGQALPHVWGALLREVLSSNSPRIVEMRCGKILYALDLVPIADAGYVNLYGQDITERARAQAELLAARDELEERVQERTRELAEANRVLAVLSQSERQQRLAAEALLEATAVLSGSLNLDDVLDRILTQVQRAIPCTAVAIMPLERGPANIARQRGLDEHGWTESGLRALVLPEVWKTVANSGLRVPVLITDTAALSDAHASGGLEWVRSLVVAPLEVEQQLIGILCGLGDETGCFSPGEVYLMEGFATHAATAIRNAEQYEAQLHARELAEKLAEAEESITRSLDIDQVMQDLLDHLQKLTDCDGAGIALMSGHGRLTLRASRDLAGLLGVDQDIDADTPQPLQALLEAQQSLLICDTGAYPGWDTLTQVDDVVSWLGVPLLVGGRTIGVCELCRREGRPFSQEHQRVAETLVGRAAVAIQNAWLFGQVRNGQERLQALSRRLVDVQEQERRYIARELHDEAAQALVSLKMGLGLLEREAPQPEMVRAGVGHLRGIVDGIIDDLHRLTIYLRPASLDHLGLVPALRQYVQDLADEHHLTAAYEAGGLTERLAPDVETAIFRIVQEALSNVVRHANATRVDVLLDQRDGKWIVLVEDNGVGFDPLAHSGHDRLGLVGMRERAEMLGGTLVVESKPNQGTTVLVEVPCGAFDSYRG